MTTLENFLFWKLICACHRSKSVAKACAQLDIRLSAASKLIAAFEKETGLILLDRSSRPARFTPDFERLVPVAGKMLKTQTEARNTLQMLQSEKSGDTVQGRLIRLCLPINVRNDTVITRLLDYAEATPGLRLEFFADGGFKRLISGDADIAQFGFHPKRQDIRADYIRTNGFLLLASRTFAERFGLPQSVEDLPKFPVVLRNPGNRSFSRRLEKGETAYFLPDGPNLIYADPLTCHSLLLAGRAISIDVSIGTVLPELKAGALLPVLDGWHRRPNDTYVCCHMKLSDDPVINDLMHIIQTTFREEQEDRWERWFRHFGLDPEAVKGAL